jgi:hypothetical protein
LAFRYNICMAWKDAVWMVVIRTKEHRLNEWRPTPNPYPGKEMSTRAAGCITLAVSLAAMAALSSPGNVRPRACAGAEISGSDGIFSGRCSPSLRELLAAARPGQHNYGVDC